MTYVIQFVLAMIATIAFALLFCAPKKELVFCGLSGALGWIVYYILFQLNGNVVLASLVATFILTVFSRTMAVVRRNPATVYLLCGIFPLVPGAGIYYTAYYLIQKKAHFFPQRDLKHLKLLWRLCLELFLDLRFRKRSFTAPGIRNRNLIGLHQVHWRYLQSDLPCLQDQG